MPASTLIESLTHSGAVIGDYAGSRTPISFGAPERELEALRSGCAVFDLAWRAKLIITGEDRVRWTNGMVTNNIRDLKQQHGNYSFVLNAQGRIQNDATIVQRGDHLLLLTEAAQFERLKSYLDRYIIMDDVELTDVSDKLSSIGVAGPTAESTLRTTGLLPRSLETGEVADETWNGIGYSIARSAIEKHDGYEIWLAYENVPTLWRHLVSSGATQAGSQAIEWRRILSGIPRVGADIGERELPQETAQEYALHYAKGCYIGQEIVERIHSRGNVHRAFGAVEVSGSAPERGAKILMGDKEVGEVTTSAAIPLRGATRSFALGFIRREASAPGTSLKVADADAKIVALPLTD